MRRYRKAISPGFAWHGRGVAGLLAAQMMLLPSALAAQQASAVPPPHVTAHVQAAAQNTIAGPALVRQNLRQRPIDGQSGVQGHSSPAYSAEDGMRFGAFILRPAIHQGMSYESEWQKGRHENRILSQTSLKGTLTSDWSRHELSLGGEAIWQKSVSGKGPDQPLARLDAHLRLDLAEETTALINGRYRFEREDASAPSATPDAIRQAGVHEWGSGMSLRRELGLLRGALSGTVTRYQFTKAKRSDGVVIDTSERNRSRADLSVRLGYALSPAITPFVQSTLGRILYDDRLDSNGYRRSADLYGAAIGVELDLGEKLRGELALGYEQQDFDDARLQSLSALTINGHIDWSMKEGTTLGLTLESGLEPSTFAAENGAAVYRLEANLSHVLRRNLVARLSAATTRHVLDASTREDTTRYQLASGLTWSLNSAWEATANLSYEHQQMPGGGATQSLAARVGLTARR